MTNNDLPIGIFDSGVGGLTVAKQIHKYLPNESILYLGDTARIPYGTRSKETIKKFAIELANYLLKQNVKCLVIACNSISANALEEIKQISPVPVFDVISPVLSKINSDSFVIATKATINSQKYPCEGKACSLFVPLVEEGLADSEIALMAAKKYLSDFKNKTLILGCTHFPIMRSTIEKTVGQNVKIIDPGEELAIKMNQELGIRNQAEPYMKFFVTDSVNKAKEVAGYFWPESLKYEWRQVEI